MTNVEHATWKIERTYPAPRHRVFEAWANVEVKRQWFVGPDGASNQTLTSDFRVGGVGSTSGSAPNGQHYTYESVYRDIVADEQPAS